MSPKTNPDQEANDLVAAIQTEEQKMVAAKKADVIFVSKQTALSLANFEAERVTDSGRIVKREKSLNFTDHFHVTGDPDEIEFIRASKEHKIGEVLEARDMAEAQKYRSTFQALKGIRRMSVEEVSSTDYGEFKE